MAACGPTIKALLERAGLFLVKEELRYEKISEGMLALKSLFGELTDEEILASKVRHEISKIIIQSRLELKLEQSEYAKRLGVSKKLLSLLESGDYILQGRTITPK